MSSKSSTKKVSIIILTIIVLIAIVIVGSSYFVGKTIQSGSKRYIAFLNQQYHSNIKITHYNRGWFSSDATIEEHDALLPGSSSVTANLHIVHGPLIFKHGLPELAMAKISSSSANVHDVANAKFNGKVAINGDVQITANLMPDAKILDMANMFIGMQLPGEKLSIGAIQFNSTVHDHYTKIDSLIRISDLAIGKNKLDSLQISSNGALQGNNMSSNHWIMNTELLTTGLNIQNLLGQNISYDKIQLGPVQLDSTSLQQFKASNLLDPNQLNAIINKLLAKLITPETVFAVDNFHYQSQFGKVNFNLNENWVGMPKQHSAEDIYTYVKAKMHLQIPNFNFSQPASNNQTSMATPNQPSSSELKNLDILFDNTPGAKSHINLGHIHMTKYGTDIFKLSNLKFGMTVNREKQLFSDQMNLSVDNICADQQCYKNILADVLFKNFNRSAFTKLHQLMMTQYAKSHLQTTNTQATNAQQLTQQLASNIGPIINIYLKTLDNLVNSKSMIIVNHAGVTTKAGENSISGNLSWPNYDGKSDLLNTMKYQITNQFPAKPFDDWVQQTLKGQASLDYQALLLPPKAFITLKDLKPALQIYTNYEMLQYQHEKILIKHKNSYIISEKRDGNQHQINNKTLSSTDLLYIKLLYGDDNQKVFDQLQQMVKQKPLNPNAALLLGYMYSAGISVDPDLAQAKHYLGLAADQGNQTAKVLLKQLNF